MNLYRRKESFMTVREQVYGRVVDRLLSENPGVNVTDPEFQQLADRFSASMLYKETVSQFFQDHPDLVQHEGFGNPDVFRAFLTWGRAHGLLSGETEEEEDESYNP
jgi:hypothetical protein